MTDDREIYRTLAYVIQKWRLDADKSRAQVYEKAGLNKNVYERLEKNERPFSAAQIRAIAAVYKRRGSDLLGEAEDLLEANELPPLPNSVRKWRSSFGYRP